MEDELDCKVQDCIVCSVGRPIANVLLTNTSWTSMLKLVLSVLHYCMVGQEYFGNNEITLFVKVHWDQIHGSKPWTDEFKSRVSDCLSHNPKCFESRERGKWRLKDKNLMPPLIAQLKKMANSTDTTPLSPSLYSSSPSISVSSSSSNSSPSSPSSPTSSPVSSPVQTRRPRGRPPIYTNNTRNRDLPCLDNTLSSSTKLSKRKLVADENTKESKCARSPQLSPRSSPMSSSPSSSYSVPLSPSSPEYFYTASSTVRRSSLSSSVYPHHSPRMNIPYYPSPPSSPTYISPRTPPYACSPYTPSTPYPTSTFYPPASPYAPSTTYTPSTPSHYNSSYIPQVPHLNPPTLPALSPSASLTLSSSTSLTLPPLLSHHDRETSSFRWEGYRHAIDRGMVDMLSM